MSAVPSMPLPALQVEHLRPYAKAVVLEYTGTKPMPDALAALVADLKRMCRSTSARAVSIVAEGFGELPVRLPSVDSLPDQGHLGHGQQLASTDDEYAAGDSLVGAFVVSAEKAPGWATEASGYIETCYALTVVAWWSTLVAVHADGGVVDKIQNWLDGRTSPPFRRVPAGVLQATLLTGEAKSLWLRGAHARRTTKADAKTIAGSRVQDALNPLEDSTFAMGSFRAEMLPTHPDLAALTGVIGTTPRKSLVWMSACSDFEDFLTKIRDLLRALRRSLGAGLSVERPYPWLAVEQRDLAGVCGAYEVVPTSSEHLEPGSDQDLVEAAGLLERATLRVDQVIPEARFVMAVGLDGSTGGNVECQPVMTRGRVDLRIGPSGNGTDPDQVREVVRALRDHPDLLTVYYESGHAIHSRAVWSAQVRPAAFPNWSWQDFNGYDITREKPLVGSPQEIHDAIATGGDRSLFSWVVNVYASDGWLTCDDGSGEIADFVVVRPDGRLELIHVKAAASASPGRDISTAVYEVVASQATKNLMYLDPERLVDQLDRALPYTPASWSYGARTITRQEIVEAVLVREASDPLQVTVVQPHLQRSRYSHVGALPGSNPNKPRLTLLETLLNSTRASTTGLGADLVVVADQS